MASKTITTEEAMKLLAEAEQMSREERLELQRERLHELVDEVRQTSPYFRELYKNIPADYTLSDLPMTRKEELVEHYDTWVTDPEATHEKAMEYLEKGVEAGLFLGKYSALHTSGTTGDPMTLLRDSYHNVIHGAMVSRRLLGEAGVDLMNIRKHRRAAVVFADKGASAYSSAQRVKRANPGFEGNMEVFSTTLSSEEIIRGVQAYQPETLSGYPSSLALLATAKNEGKLDVPVRFVVSSAEVMTPELYRLIRDSFDCPVVNNYCSTEAGEAAMASDCPHLHMNEDWVIIEPVKQDGSPVEDPEEWSEGILVTDLTNYIQPIIRYYMSDRVRIHLACDMCDNPFPWMEIAGRVGGLITVCGKQIMSVALISITGEDVANVYQYIQRADNRFEIRVLPKKGMTRQEMLEILRDRFDAYLKSEGCEGYEITLSMEDPIKNKRGGKLSHYLNMIS